MKQDAGKEEKQGKTSLGKIIGLAMAVVLLVFCLVGAVGLRNRSTFTQEKWLRHPESRARITDNLLDQYDLIGMTEQEVLDLLGPNDNRMGYFTQENRFVYCLGGERLIMDSEWLLIDFTDGVVSDYSMITD